uniref:Uncharacterized protein n=1 Tax=Anguilla anguilla TaxID=7936 RepID=A0A0E9P6E4_ANGAN
MFSTEINIQKNFNLCTDAKSGQFLPISVVFNLRLYDSRFEHRSDLKMA